MSNELTDINNILISQLRVFENSKMSPLLALTSGSSEVSISGRKTATKPEADPSAQKSNESQGRILFTYHHYIYKVCK